jgi:hypothetical protein
LGEFAGDVDTERIDDRDNDERDERCDQAIFNGRGADSLARNLRKIGQEFKKNSPQISHPFRLYGKFHRCEIMRFRNLRLSKFRLVNFTTSDGAAGDGRKR